MHLLDKPQSPQPLLSTGSSATNHFTSLTLRRSEEHFHTGLKVNVQFRPELKAERSLSDAASELHPRLICKKALGVGGRWMCLRQTRYYTKTREKGAWERMSGWAEASMIYTSLSSEGTPPTVINAAHTKPLPTTQAPHLGFKGPLHQTEQQTDVNPGATQFKLYWNLVLYSNRRKHNKPEPGT